jgi:hypothetical protein
MCNFKWFLAVVSTALVAAGCATVPAVYVDRDPTANLSAYQTFAFYSEPGRGYSTLVDEHIKRATRAELERRGYRYDEQNPDLRVAFAVKIDERQELRSTPALGVGRFYGAFNAYEIDTVDYKAGTLMIHVVDSARDTLVWQGVAEGRVERKTLQNPAATIGAIVAEIFADFAA